MNVFNYTRYYSPNKNKNKKTKNEIKKKWHTWYRDNGFFLLSCFTLFGETFARETFANFANLTPFRESLCREKFKIAHSRKFISRNFAIIFNSRKFIQ